MSKASASTQAARAELFAGLYDGRPPAEPTPRSRGRARHVRILNPTCADEDPTTRRFAQLEIE